jgi:hypothetical protein
LQKVFGKGGNGKHGGQMSSGSGAPLHDLAAADFATLYGGIEESCFLCKKVAKWYKRLKNY